MRYINDKVDIQNGVKWNISLRSKELDNNRYWTHAQYYGFNDVMVTEKRENTVNCNIEL